MLNEGITCSPARGKRLLYAALVLGTGVLVVAATLVETLQYLLAALGGVLLVLFSAARPRTALKIVLVTAILVPVDLAVKVDGLPRVGPTRIILGCFLVGLAAHELTRSSASGTRRTRELGGAWLLYIAAAAMSAVTSVKPLVSAYAVIGREGVEQWCVFLAALLILRGQAEWQDVKRSLYVVTAVVCLLAVVEEAIGANPLLSLFPGEREEFRLGWLRCRATFFHPIALGCFLNLMAPFVTMDFLTARRTASRLLLGSLWLSITTASMLTLSRAPLALLLAECLSVVVWRWRRDIRRLVIIGSVGVVGAAVILGGAMQSGALRELVAPLIGLSDIQKDSTEYYRWVVMREVWDRVSQERLALGFGPNAFDLADVTTSEYGGQRMLTAPDQHYARVLFEYGIVGLLAFLGLLSRAVVGCVKRRRRPLDDHVMSCVTALTGFVAINATVSLFSMFPLGGLFWLVAGAARAEARASE